ncbi:MAG: diguanylate cyclase, partial [Alphaproteobacteria bacterium]|nr:diguanylate cyclase [Alphaproteobacteria bacterium]
LGRVVDDHIAWLAQWHQVAFYGGINRASKADEAKMPNSFLQWYDRAAVALPNQGAILTRIADLHEQLHMAAKMVLLRSPDGEAIPIQDYEKVLQRFDEFLTSVRRLERAYSEAAAGLDALTGLRTRTGLQDDFNREVNRFKNAQTPFIMAMVDIDHFKNVNDTHGHDMGDRVLVGVSNTLLRHIRTYDEAYRLGGEEFFLILKGLDNDGADKVLERLRNAVARNEVKTPDGTIVKVTASFGYVMIEEGKTMDELLQLADQALYKAKREGRNRIVRAS